MTQNKTMNEALDKIAQKDYEFHNAKAEKYGRLYLADGLEEYRPLWAYHRDERNRCRRILKG